MIPGSSSAKNASSLTEAEQSLLEAYRATRWSVRLRGSTLRLAVGAAAPAGPGELAVVTACNPASNRSSVQQNRAATRRLQARLRASGLAWLPARGHGHGAEARRWDEPGFALVGPGAIAAALRLGGELGQNAIVAVRAGQRAVLLVSRGGFCGRAAGEALPG